MIDYESAETLLMVCLATLVMVGCDSWQPISFSQEVKPILELNCIRCHTAGAEGQKASGFSMETYDDLMRGTNYGPMVIAGDSESSNIITLMEGRADPSISMPHGEQKAVSKADIEKIRLWIDQGAKNN